MTIQFQGLSGYVAEVGGPVFRGLHVHVKPLEYGALGHYRASARFALANAQAAASRLYEMRNSGTNLVIPTRMTIKWLQTVLSTAAILDSLDVFKDTAFSAVDTASTVTPTLSVKRGATMAAAPGGIQVRHVTAAGVAAGMTAGTRTPDGNPFASLPKWLLGAVPTAGDVPFSFLDVFDDVNGTHPFVFANNEGFEIQNRVLLGASAGADVTVDLGAAEVAAF